MSQVAAVRRERPTIPCGVRLGIIFVCGFIFGELENVASHWPAWAFYPPELLLTFSFRFALGIVLEKPRQFSRRWKSLYWRVLCFESSVWAWSMVMFFSLLGTSNKKDGLLWLLVAGVVYVVSGILSKGLISTFHCPYCNQFFFKKKNIKEGEGLFPFSLSQWPNTCCQNCEWPLWKPVDLEQAH
jgi:hypothetical protein